MVSPHVEGVALILAPEAQRSVTCWEPVNLKFISTQFATQSENIKRIIIQDYTLASDGTEGKKSRPARGGSGQRGRCHYFCAMPMSELTTTAMKTKYDHHTITLPLSSLMFPLVINWIMKTIKARWKKRVNFWHPDWWPWPQVKLGEDGTLEDKHLSHHVFFHRWQTFAGGWFLHLPEEYYWLTRWHSMQCHC